MWFISKQIQTYSVIILIQKHMHTRDWVGMAVHTGRHGDQKGPNETHLHQSLPTDSFCLNSVKSIGACFPSVFSHQTLFCICFCKLNLQKYMVVVGASVSFLLLYNKSLQMQPLKIACVYYFTVSVHQFSYGLAVSSAQGLTQWISECQLGL